MNATPSKVSLETKKSAKVTGNNQQPLRGSGGLYVGAAAQTAKAKRLAHQRNIDQRRDQCIAAFNQYLPLPDSDLATTIKDGDYYCSIEECN